MSWNYAEMSKAAKAVGGPEKYAEKLIEYGIQEGVKKGKVQMLPVVAVVAAVSTLATYFGLKVVHTITGKSKKNEITAEEAEVAKEAFIKGINDYDQEQAEHDTEDENQE